jgi:hypothetical protein
MGGQALLQLDSGFVGDTVSRKIFVFGSNLAGRHGAGAAKYARQHHGAVYGQGVGLQGNSYAIPTKDEWIRTLPLDIIKEHVQIFLRYARENPTMLFELTPIGCGLAGYEPSDIAPLFIGAPSNVVLPRRFIKWFRSSLTVTKNLISDFLS